MSWNGLQQMLITLGLSVLTRQQFREFGLYIYCRNFVLGLLMNRFSECKIPVQFFSRCRNLCLGRSTILKPHAAALAAVDSKEPATFTLVMKAHKDWFLCRTWKTSRFTSRRYTLNKKLYMLDLSMVAEFLALSTMLNTSFWIMSLLNSSVNSRQKYWHWYTSSLSVCSVLSGCCCVVTCRLTQHAVCTWMC
jgi:hypothetical protein